MQKCCNKMYCTKISKKMQETFFKSFWLIGDYNQQNYFLSGLMTKSNPKFFKVNPETKNWKWSWTYCMVVRGEKFTACKTFLYSMLQINIKRIDVLQNKIGKDESLSDMRGKPTVRPNKIVNEIWELLREFCKQIPSKSSYYSKTCRFYFSNPQLNIQILYNMFFDYYLSVSGDNLPIAFITFQKYFNTIPVRIHLLVQELMFVICVLKCNKEMHVQKNFHL